MLRVKNLAAGYRNRAVARLTSLDLSGGQAALLIGASGVGKTTLLLAIAGLARRFGGEVDFGDGASPHRLARSIGFVFQDLHLIAGLNALDNVLLAPFACGVRQDRPRALALLDSLGLSALAKRPAERLSRGEAQRVAVARAMLMAPKVLLADEPTASLDDAACADVTELLLRASAETGAALLIATHDARLKARIPVHVMAEAV